MNKPIHPRVSHDGPSPAYESDPHGWAIAQAAFLRTGRIDQVDWINVAEEVEDVARSERRAAESALLVTIKHILKWHAQPERRGTSWQKSIRAGRAKYHDTIEDNPSLAAAAEDMLARAFRRAKRDAAAEMGIEEAQLASEALSWHDILERPYVIER